MVKKSFFNKIEIFLILGMVNLMRKISFLAQKSLTKNSLKRRTMLGNENVKILRIPMKATGKMCTIVVMKATKIQKKKKQV